MLYRDVTREEFWASAAAASKAIKSKSSIDHFPIYKTKGYAHANGGHTFDDHLTKPERRAIIEFLKSLSGQDMKWPSRRCLSNLSLRVGECQTP